MNYSDTTNLNGIIQEEERLTGLGYAGISGVTEKLKEFTSLNNIASHQIWHIIFTANGNWQFDDANQTDLPSSTCDIVSGTSKYPLPDDALTVKRIEIKDANEVWFTLQPITLEEISVKGEFLTDSGTPRFYTLINGTIELFPTPNYDSTAGFHPFFDRDCVEFATTDTDTAPGFASPYHSVIAVKGALAWIKVHFPTSGQIPLLQQDEIKLETDIKKFYGLRFKDKKPRVGRAYSSYR